ncbi:PLDc N-terminal domain-containing protein [Kocuria flava]|uniref:PLDc N-terminal domain-containing protein n=1 Tax=Kocuria flava TaxID=446860 RepID=UPI0021518F48|nr:PLDc N-terminal domain-containing protein [Kocuria flava]
MGRAILIIGAAALAVGVIVYSLIECARTDSVAMRGLRKGGWIAVILLLPLVGALLWLFLGRPRAAQETGGPARAKGPDDDPQFLRNLEERRRQQQQAEKLRRWEEELRRKGGPAAGDGSAPPPGGRSPAPVRRRTGAAPRPRTPGTPGTGPAAPGTAGTGTPTAARAARRAATDPAPQRHTVPAPGTVAAPRPSPPRDTAPRETPRRRRDPVLHARAARGPVVVRGSRGRGGSCVPRAGQRPE